jgi:hypothetical protein
MSQEDEADLHRLCNMLGEVHNGLEAGSPLREAVTKAALGLSFAYMHGGRNTIENRALGVGAPLGEAQREHLRSLGLNPKRTDA